MNIDRRDFFVAAALSGFCSNSDYSEQEDSDLANRAVDLGCETLLAIQRWDDAAAEQIKKGWQE